METKTEQKQERAQDLIKWSNLIKCIYIAPVKQHRVDQSAVHKITPPSRANKREDEQKDIEYYQKEIKQSGIR